MTPLPVLMGVVNVPPDSFSDGGRWATTDAGLIHAGDMLADGADILDIGGESTRPGAPGPHVEAELGRVVPVTRALADGGAVVSVDTMRSEVAAEALAAGATIVNDVSGGLADPRILDVVADSDATYVCMHWRAHSDRMTDFAVYDGPGGVLAAVRDELSERVDAARKAGVPDERIVLDPGLGFAKRAAHNWRLLTGIPVLQSLGFRMHAARSRKSFLGTVLADADGEPRPVDDREGATAALTVLLAHQRVWGLRVHDVKAARDALRTFARWEQG